MRTLALEPMHGWAIAQRIQQISNDLLRVQQGSLYPALHRLEHQGWITAEWGASENNRRARFFSLTKAGRTQLGGGAVGSVPAWWGMRALQQIDLPVTVDLTLDYRVLAFAIGLSVVTGVAFGLAPALKATRGDLLSTLRDADSSRSITGGSR